MQYIAEFKHVFMLFLLIERIGIIEHDAEQLVGHDAGLLHFREDYGARRGEYPGELRHPRLAGIPRALGGFDLRRFVSHLTETCKRHCAAGRRGVPAPDKCLVKVRHPLDGCVELRAVAFLGLFVAGDERPRIGESPERGGVSPPGVCYERIAPRGL